MDTIRTDIRTVAQLRTAVFFRVIASLGQPFRHAPIR
jgi:hypothetical protein